MIRFILNRNDVETEFPPGTVLLDFIRYQKHLTGTKIGCREGDCGACTVLVGERVDNGLKYQSMTSCLVPLGNVHNKHVVTIEGINPGNELNPIQQAMAEEGATQCGFCTPGFIMSMTGFCLSDKEPKQENVITSMDGNICRCTGYKSIERAANKIAALIKERKKEDPVDFASGKKIIPAYFSDIIKRLIDLASKSNGELPFQYLPPTLISGGTDLYVQKYDELVHAESGFVFDRPELNGIRKEGNKCIIGASATITDLKNSPVIQEAFPAFNRYAKLVSSTPIRNMATIAGNFINASPIGDFTIFFLALDAGIILSDGKSGRELPLRNLYKGYKILNKNPEEHITAISFELPGKHSYFNFEKVSKRTHLDIASVNTAISIYMNNDQIKNAGISAGGVGPIPLYLQKTSEFLESKTISETLIMDTIKMAQSEISPISDARGSKEYKRLLLAQLIKAHFLKLFPELKTNALISYLF